MPAVLSRAEFDARLTPLYKNLLLCAQKRVGRDCADDVVQNTTLAAWVKVKSFAAYQGQDAFAVWVQAFLQNEIQRFIVAQAKRPQTNLPATTLFDLCDGPDAPHWEQDGWKAQRAELYQRLHNFTLTPKQRARCLRYIGGETLQEIADREEPPVSPQAVYQCIKRVGEMMQQVDDADIFDREIGELIENQPAALTYAGQMQRGNRVRREANLFAMKRALMREASRVAPRVKSVAKPVGNRKARRATMQMRRAA